tara:strand:- start:3049 stop:3447 length:399 start_codon:yes stop_codon:yes gene_type:complete
MSTLKTGTVQNNTGTGAPVFKNSSGTEIGQLAKAWINLDGTGTISIRNQFNVSSITDMATGIYKITFATAMPNADYVVVTTSGENSAGFSVLHDSGAGNYRAPTANDFLVRHADDQGTQYDRRQVAVVVFGD